MPVELLLPGRRVPAPPMPSYVKLAMAFGLGAGATLYDKSRYRSHGAITTATWVAGVHGYCLDFNPANPDYVLIPAAHTQLNFTTQDFSIIARVRFDDIDARRSIFNRGGWGTSGYYLEIDAATRLDFTTIQGAPAQTTQALAGALAINTWYTVGMSRSGAVVTLYRNGVDFTNVHGAHVNPLTRNTHAIIGGYGAGPTHSMDGKIEFLRVFGGIALSTSEHLAWHNVLA